MLDFQSVRDKRTTFADLTAGVSHDDLRNLTNEIVDMQLALVEECVDADVIFVPEDPNAHDPYAEGAGDVAIAWTLGHVIVHVTASSEEAAFIAAEMARGVEPHGRSRYEVPWESVTTIAQVRARLQESRRMRLAMLDTWPDEPHMEVTFAWGPDKPQYNAIQRFLLGMRHEEEHVAQVAEIVRQARVQREAADLVAA
jgi:uncharacterized damage-inducible protein DinB